MAHKAIQLYRGPIASIPVGADGEPIWTTDALELFVSQGGANYLIGNGDLLTITDPGTGIVPFDLEQSRVQLCELTGDRTLTISNYLRGRTFLIKLGNNGAVRTPTFWSGISWYTDGNVAPSMPSNTSAYMWLSFLPTGTGTFDGFLVGKSAL